MPELIENLDKLLQDERVQKALEFIKNDDTNTLQQQINIAQTPAPPFAEKQRSDYYRKLLENAGLTEIKQDEIHNLIGTYSNNGATKLLVSAHLDSVFAADVDVTVTEKTGIYYGAGICDDARGLATVLSIIRALKFSGIQFQGTLLFAADVGEESQGDLRGIKKIFNDYQDIDAYISIDGAEPESIIHQATGSRRYNFIFQGAGGHSFGDFGRPSAVHAATRAAAKIATMEVPKNPKTTFNVGTINGGTLPTAIAETCEMQVDIRSNSATELQKYDTLVLDLVNQAVAEENARTQEEKMLIQITIECIGNRPAGTQSDEAPIVQSALCVIEHFGKTRPQLIGASSTDANVPISLGIPAITIGGGGKSGNAHALSEWYDPQNAYLGVQQAFLLIALLLGVDGITAGVLA